MDPIAVIVGLLVLYTIAVLWQGRRAMTAQDTAMRQREAVRLLLVVSAGLPILAALIIFA